MIRALLVTVAITAAAIGAAPTAGADPMDQLVGMLPPGYGPDACQPIDTITSSIASMECRDNSLPSGPFKARYALFNDPGKLANIAKHMGKVGDETPVSCGRELAPTFKNANVGFVGCYMSAGYPNVWWTIDSSLFVGAAAGYDLDSLFQWFSKNVDVG